ncbi:hypothetical protein DVH24_009423 [Malus domestica]|uniref:AIPP2-like SPOC-like domain-containing protein n=1 Tax=Malus domestica TaxID=3750 RepID=A0A498IUP6_MALDO|nr:hypothetical protein DVH24_009423 [Malus domestica]
MGLLVTVCQTCGDKGIEDALLYCVKCQNYALHRYYLNVPAQNIFDEDLTWLCEDCDPKIVKPSRIDKSVRSTEICLNKKFKKRKKKSNRKTLPIYGAKKKVRKCEGANMKVQICEGPNMKVYEGANTKVQICEGSTSEHEAEGSNDCDNGQKLGSRCSEVHTDEFNYSNDVAKSVETSLVATCNPLKISAIICYVAAQPIIDPIWSTFSAGYNCEMLCLNDGKSQHIQQRLQHLREEAELLPLLLFPELVNRTDVWPKAFEKCGPNDQSIALYFFPDNERDEKDFDTLVVSMIQDDLTMRAVLEDAELLVFTSVRAGFQTKFYLWGVFRAKQFPQFTNSSVGVGEKDVAKPLNCYGQSPVSTLSNNVDITCAPVPLNSYCPSFLVLRLLVRPVMYRAALFPLNEN